MILSLARPLAGLLAGLVVPATLLAAPSGKAPVDVRSATLRSGSVPADRSVWPLDPRPEVVSGFSPPSDPWGAGHRGVDLLGSVGQPVRSAQTGTVSYVGTVAGVGVVVVRHGATRSTYQPVDAVVRVGQHVAAGQLLGTLALFGSHCFPQACLHWGLLDGDRYVDPLSLLGAAPVRLLPLS